MVLKTSLKIYLERNYRRLGALPSIEQLNAYNYNPEQKKCKRGDGPNKGFLEQPPIFYKIEEMKKAYKYCIYPTKEQQKYFAKTFGSGGRGCKFSDKAFQPSK
jgi:hypothetical protein